MHMHAYLQTMTKTPVKFRKNWHKTVGGVATTRCLLLYGGWKDGRKEGELKTKSLHFSSKRRGTKTIKNTTNSDHHAEPQTVFCVQTRPDKNASPDLELNCLQKLFAAAREREWRLHTNRHYFRNIQMTKR